MTGLNRVSNLTRVSLTVALFSIVCNLSVAAQSTGRKLWPRSSSVSRVAPFVDHDIAYQEEQAGQTGGLLGILEAQKTAIVGSWIGVSSEGNRIIQTYNADGTLHGSAQGEVSTIPELGVLTPGHGVWAHLGGWQFGFTAMGILYDINTGAYLGMLKARALLTLNDAGDQMSGTDKVEVFDPDGNLVFAATGNTTFTRIKFEPFN